MEWDRDDVQLLPLHTLTDNQEYGMRVQTEPDLSVISFLPGLAFMKTTVLESMCTLTYFRLDTLGLDIAHGWRSQFACIFQRD